MSDAPAVETPASEPTTELARMDHGLLAAPIYDRIDPRKLELIVAQVAENCTPPEVAFFLELCARYDLDPFAKEAWCAKSKRSGKLIIMAGRDGLRKIARKNGLHLDGDYVCANDTFKVMRTADGNRTVVHEWSLKERGELVGAWAEVREGGPTGRPMGFYFAQMSEFKPKGDLDLRSPWHNQPSVMVMGAAAKQAIRMATPLGGLAVEGEDDTIRSNEMTGLPVAPLSPEDLVIPWPDDEALASRLQEALERIHAIEPNELQSAELQMRLGGQTDNVLAQIADEWELRADMLESQETEEPPDAEVVYSDEEIKAMRARREELAGLLESPSLATPESDVDDWQLEFDTITEKLGALPIEF